MFETFCQETGLRDDIRFAMERMFSEHRDQRLVQEAEQACARRDQDAFSSSLSRALDLYGPVYPLVLLGLCYDITRRFYPDDAIRTATLSDIAVWEDRYERCHGIIGLDRVRWVARHACGRIWRLGRLQYEFSPYPFSNVISLDEERNVFHVTDMPVTGWKCIEKKGMDAVRLHIPEGGKLLPSLVDDSLMQASAFFPWALLVVCDSWLLDPNLEIVCQDSPNILSFMRRFAKFPIKEEGEPQIFERVFFFGATKADVLVYPCRTPLQRRVQDAVRHGVEFHTTGGFVKLIR